MSKSLLAKIFGWAQFGIQVVGQITANPGGLPHGALGWTSFIGSLLSAIGIHHASSTGGTQ